MQPNKCGSYDCERTPSGGCKCGCDNIGTCTWCGKDILAKDELNENGDHLICWRKEWEHASE